MASDQTLTFADLLRRARRDAELTQEGLAERAGVSARGISDLERGVIRAPRRDTLELLLDALELPAEARAIWRERREEIAGSPRPSQPMAAASASPTSPPPALPRAPLASGERETVRQWSSAVSRGSELPLPLTSFIGREREIAAVAALFERSGARLVSLTGPGGIGKTRLALEVAEHLGNRFPDSVWFVPLASITDSDLVVPTIARILEIAEQADQPMLERLAGYLRERQALLVLDNFEHVVGAAAAIAHVLADCPALAVLVTSREPLRLSGEHEYAVPPLEIAEARNGRASAPLPDGDAVELFVERARLAASDFALTTENSRVIVAICRRLDGLPLALELAAARIKLLSAGELLERLDQPLALLIGGPRDAPERQQTMRATLQWSYDLLSPEEQQVFRGLSVFVGGWTLAAGEAIVGGGDILELLASLVDKGLARRIEPSGQLARYGMLEPVRQFAWECLTESGAEETRIRDRHAAYFQSTIDGLRRRADEEDGPAVLDRVETEHDNLRAALGWLQESGQIERSLRLVGHLAIFWEERGYISEGWARTAAVLNHPEAGRRTTARARALYAAAWLLLFRGEIQPGFQLSDEMVGISEERDDPQCLAEALFARGASRDRLGDREQARADFERALPLFREVEDDAMVVRMLTYLGGLASDHGDVERAEALLIEGLALARGRRLPDALALALGGLSSLAARSGDDERAAELFAERVALYRELGKPVLMAAALQAIAIFLRRRQQLEAAVCLFSVASELHERSGSMTVGLPGSIVVPGALDKLRPALPDAIFEAAWARGRAMDVEQAVELARQSMLAIQNESTLMPPAGLTPREIEILQLLAAGRSNRQIADDLFLSSRTVERHVTNIYSKIDVHNRAEATAFAIEHGLA